MSTITHKSGLTKEITVPLLSLISSFQKREYNVFSVSTKKLNVFNKNGELEFIINIS